MGTGRDFLDRLWQGAGRGEESMRHLLNLYAGHDILHLNQIARIKRALR